MKLSRLLLMLLCCVYSLGYAAHSKNANSKLSSQQNSNNADVVQISNNKIGSMLMQSLGLLGIRYQWGGNTPKQGMDCSGFIRYLFQQSLGISLPRTAAQMAKVGKRVSVDKLQQGDLLFFNTKRGANTHVGMYIGDNKFIQSPRTGEDIQITELNSYWRHKINGAKRIIEEDSDNKVLTEYQEEVDQPLPTKIYSSKAPRRTHKVISVAKSHSPKISKRKRNKKRYVANMGR
jgi:hypothetical protein